MTVTALSEAEYVTGTRQHVTKLTVGPFTDEDTHAAARWHHRHDRLWMEREYSGGSAAAQDAYETLRELLCNYFDAVVAIDVWAKLCSRCDGGTDADGHICANCQGTGQIVQVDDRSVRYTALSPREWHGHRRVFHLNGDVEISG